MKLDERNQKLPLTDEQRFFATCWYNMVHAFSLDSYRVRAMNPVNVTRELLKMTKPPANTDDMAMVASEAVQLYKRDPVLNDQPFHNACSELLGLLQIPKGKDGGDKPLEKYRGLIQIFATELLDCLNQRYLTATLDKLRELLTAGTGPNMHLGDQFKQIDIVTGNLLSYLLDSGASVESLFQLYQQVIIGFKPKKAYKFDRKFDLLCKLVNRPSEEYTVVFAIENTTNPGGFPSQIGGIKFSVVPPVVDDPTTSIQKYIIPNPRRLFATVEVKAHDSRFAGSRAYARVNDVMDLVRFEYERQRAVVLEEFIIAENSKPQNFRIFPIPKVVPNPSVSVNAGELELFVRSVNELTNNPIFGEEGRDRVQAAFRLYRIGADTNIFENKFTNWWTAIEYLVKGGNGIGSIGKGVEDAMVPVLCLGYVQKLLRSFANTIANSKMQIVHPQSGQVIHLQTLTGKQLYALFKDAAMKPILLAAAVDPFLKYKLEPFLEAVADSKKLLKMIQDHEQRLRWHLQRLYRTRCDIVHSADRTVNAALLCANLEFYLKHTLTGLLRSLAIISTMRGPKEYFDRQTHQYNRLKATLADSSDLGLLGTLI